MKRALSLAALLLASCAGPGGVLLAPVEINPSFAHMGGGRICLVGADWAMEMGFAEGFPASGVATKAPDTCFLFRGRGLATYFFPSAGPLNPLTFEKDKLPKSPVQGLKVTGGGAHRFATGEVSTYVFSGFSVDGVDYAPIGSVKLDIRGPFP